MFDILGIDDNSMITGYFSAMIHSTDIVSRQIYSTFRRKKSVNLSFTGKFRAKVLRCHLLIVGVYLLRWWIHLLLLIQHLHNLLHQVLFLFFNDQQ